VVFRVREVRSGTAADVRDTGSPMQAQHGQLSPPLSPHSGTPRGSGPQVAVLGSPQVGARQHQAS
jgi:hypothetical protein